MSPRMLLHTLLATALCTLALQARAADAQAPAELKGTPGDFGYYALALSWSPEYCAGPKGSSSPEQCGKDGHFGFVVHGLWPQYDAGGYPSSCQVPAKVPASLAEVLRDIMPDAGLIQHEWEKHGTCTGMDVQAYFDAVRSAFHKVIVPPELKAPKKTFVTSVKKLETLFAQANPGLDAQGLAVQCNKSRVTQILVCMDKQFGLRRCGAEIKDKCGSGKLTVRPVR